ncbi:MAG: transposase [Lachnospiraceae bacterium]
MTNSKNNKIKKNYERDTSLIYYDVTNYYFESDDQNDFLRKGVSKEHRPNPIVQMGLFMDNNGIPITYELFPGNTNDCLTYRPNFGRIKKEFHLGRVISVADKGMTTGDNIWYTINTPTKDGYVFSMSVRGAEKSMKDYVLLTSEMEESDDKIIDIYRGLWRIEESFKVTKSELEARPVYVWTKEHIEAHFLTCFVALIIARILEIKLERKYSIGKILESLSNSECTLIQQNYYLFDYYDDVLKDIGKAMDIDFSKRIRTLGDRKKVLADTKK